MEGFEESLTEFPNLQGRLYQLIPEPLAVQAIMPTRRCVCGYPDFSVHGKPLTFESSDRILDRHVREKGSR